MSERLENSQIEMYANYCGWPGDDVSCQHARIMAVELRERRAARWWHSLRCLVLVACAVLLIFAVVSIVALRLRVTDAEVQLDMCRRNGAQ